MKRTSSWITRTRSVRRAAPLKKSPVPERAARAAAPTDAQHALASATPPPPATRCRQVGLGAVSRATSTSVEFDELREPSRAPGRTRGHLAHRHLRLVCRNRCRRAGPVICGKRSRSRRMMSRVSSTDSVVCEVRPSCSGRRPRACPSPQTLDEHDPSGASPIVPSTSSCPSAISTIV